MLTIFAGVTLIDGTGAPPLEQATVVVKNGRIAAVQTSDQPLPQHEPGALWDLSGLTLMPGLIDAHVHLLANADPRASYEAEDLTNSSMALIGVNHARLTLEAGFTTVRDMAAVNEPIFALRRATMRGVLPGPRIIASGKCLTITGGHGTEYGVPMAWVVDGPQEFLKAVRKQIHAGADFIKVIGTRGVLSPPYQSAPSFTVEEMQPGIAEAHAVGFLVAAHAHSSIEGIRNVVLAGVDHVEHGNPADNDTLDMMAAKGVMLVPTLSFWDGLRDLDKEGLYSYGEERRKKLPSVFEGALDTVRRAHARGVPIALGTDAGNPMDWHGDNARELLLLIEAGLSPMEAIVSATLRAAEACGRDNELGTVEPGKLADLVVVDGNPLGDPKVLRNTENIRLVMQSGKVVVNRGLSAVTTPSGSEDSSS